MPSGTLIFLVVVIGLLLWTNALDTGDRVKATESNNFAYAPYFLRYNAPNHPRGQQNELMPTRSMPIGAVALGTNGFDGMSIRVT